MRKSEIRRLFGAIVEFAGVERLLHTPVKHYSGGMYARLAFSVAAHLRAPILAVDEVLAVGDAQFRQKCLSRMSDLGDEGRTVLFVSHDLGPIRRLCERVIWLADGRLRMDGDPDDVIQSYLSNAAPATHFARPRSDHPAQHVDVMSVAVRQADEDGSSLLYRDRPLTITTRCRMAAGVPPIDVILSLRNAHGVLVLEEALGDQADLIDAADAEWEADVSMHVPPVLPAGDYVLGVRVSSYYEEYVMNADVLRFRLLPRHDDAQWSAERRRAVQPPVSWEIRPV
jgi:ABC-type glutathione transport system ATPase component